MAPWIEAITASAPASGRVLRRCGSAAAWHDEPSFAIVSARDGILSTALQRFMAKRAGSTVTAIASSRVPFLSHPAEVAEVVEAAAERAGS